MLRSTFQRVRANRRPYPFDIDKERYVDDCKIIIHNRCSLKFGAQPSSRHIAAKEKGDSAAQKAELERSTS
jgi:hypothetical protein